MRLAAAVLLLAIAGGTARAQGIGSAGSPAHDAAEAAHDDLAEAIRLEAALQYDQALAIVEKIIAAGMTTDPARLAELHIYAGKLAAGIDHTADARDHFARALAIRPELALPAGTSPKITAPFDDARATTAPLRLHANAAGAVIDADPLGMVRRTQTIGTQAEALDEHGNVVWRGALVAAPTPVVPTVAQSSIAGRASTWAIGAGAALVIGGLCAWRFEVAQDDWNRFSQDGLHDYTQLRAIETRGDHWGIAADVSFGVAAAAGVTAAILYVAHRPGPSVVASDHYVGVAARF